MHNCYIIENNILYVNHQCHKRISSAYKPSQLGKVTKQPKTLSLPEIFQRSFKAYSSFRTRKHFRNHSIKQHHFSTKHSYMALRARRHAISSEWNTVVPETVPTSKGVLSARDGITAVWTSMWGMLRVMFRTKQAGNCEKIFFRQGSFRKTSSKD